MEQAGSKILCCYCWVNIASALAFPFLNFLLSIYLYSYCIWSLTNMLIIWMLFAVVEFFTSVFLFFLGVLITHLLSDSLCYGFNFHKLLPHTTCSLFFFSPTIVFLCKMFHLPLLSIGRFCLQAMITFPVRNFLLLLLSFVGVWRHSFVLFNILIT